jgi:hypothetical protein
MKKHLSLLSIFIICISCNQLCADKNCSTKSKASNTISDTALVCKLSPDAKLERVEKLRETVFKGYEKMNELPDAIELVYSDGKKYAPLLVEFINSERDCCPFFTFNIKFEPNSEKVSLTVGGSAKIKEMIKGIMK